MALSVLIDVSSEFQSGHIRRHWLSTIFNSIFNIHLAVPFFFPLHDKVLENRKSVILVSPSQNSSSTFMVNIKSKLLHCCAKFGSSLRCGYYRHAIVCFVVQQACSDFQPDFTASTITTCLVYPVSLYCNHYLPANLSTDVYQSKIASSSYFYVHYNNDVLRTSDSPKWHCLARFCSCM